MDRLRLRNRTMSEEPEWHFISVVDQQQYGPYTADQLQEFVGAGSVTPETMVWTEVLDDWIPAANVEGLFDVSAQSGRPQLLTGAAAQAARPLGAAPTPAPAQAAMQVQPLQQAPVQPVAQAVPQQPVAQAIPQQQPVAQAVPQQQVAPGTIPGAMPQQQMAAVPGQPGMPGAPRVPSVPPGTDYPVPPGMKASFGLIMTFFCAALVCAGVALFGGLFKILKAVNDGKQGDALIKEIGESGAIMGIGAGAGSLCWITFAILSVLTICRAWTILQPGGARTTPGKGGWFLIIPLFNLYWGFVGIAGLAKDWNRIMSSYPNLVQAPRLSEGLFLAQPIVFAACAVGFLANPILAMILQLAAGIMLLVVIAALCKAINGVGRLALLGAQPGLPNPGGGIRLY